MLVLGFNLIGNAMRYQRRRAALMDIASL